MATQRRHIADVDWKELAELAKDAGLYAQQEAHSKGLPYIIQKEGRVIAVYPDGTQKDITDLKAGNRL